MWPVQGSPRCTLLGSRAQLILFSQFPLLKKSQKQASVGSADPPLTKVPVRGHGRTRFKKDNETQHTTPWNSQHSVSKTKASRHVEAIGECDPLTQEKMQPMGTDSERPEMMELIKALL